MRASLVTQPDGSSALILSDSRRGTSDVSTGALSAQQQTSFPDAVSTTSTLDPFNAQDMVAKKELLRMRQQDATLRAQHASIDEAITDVLIQDACLQSSHVSYDSYAPFRHMDDDKVQAAIESTDDLLQRAVAITSAGPNPILSNHNTIPTPGMHWLERMNAADASLLRSFDNQSRDPGKNAC